MADGSNAPALQCLKSLGAGGKYESNQERDFHAWLKHLYGRNLETFKIIIDLNATWLKTEGVQYFVLIYVSFV